MIHIVLYIVFIAEHVREEWQPHIFVQIKVWGAVFADGI